jgi:hypothetical protein
MYWSDYAVSDALFAGDEMISVSAAGGDVGAFSQQLRAPSLITLTAPELQSESFVVDTTRDLGVSWTGGPEGEVQVYLAGIAESDVRTVTCTAPVNSGTLTVGSVLLGDFLAYDTGLLLIRNQTATTFDASGFEIAFVLWAEAEAPEAPESVASVPVVFE